MCTIWNGLWKYVIKMGGLFISFLAKGVQSREKKLQNWKNCIFRGVVLLNECVK